MRLFLAACVVALSALPASADDWDFRIGSFGDWFCGARATFDVETQLPNSWVFRGNILIHDTNEYDAIRITQFDDNSLRITRELTGAGMGQKQTVDTAPPVIEDGMVAFYSQSGRGPGCNNPGANTALRMPLKSLEDAAQAQIADDMDPTGKTTAQCVAANNRCETRMQAYGGVSAQVQIAAQCTPVFQQCMGLIQAATQQIEEDMNPLGKTAEQCVAANSRCENRMQAYGANVLVQIAAQCTPIFQTCVANAASGDGGGNTQKVKLDVRLYDEAGNDTGTDVPAGTEVVVGACDDDNCRIDGGPYHGKIYDGPDYDTLDR